MINQNTKKPYVKCIGESAHNVTQSCYLVRFKKYAILLDCGLYQESDIKTNYDKNYNLLKKIKPRNIDFIILSHIHVDHTGMVPALYAKGCQAHLYVPFGSKMLLKLLWEDSLKIMQQDCTKLQKAGYKISPFYSQDDIDKALDRVIEVGYSNIKSSPVVEYLTEDIFYSYYPAGHIIYSCQIYLNCIDGNIYHKLGYTGDIGGNFNQTLYCDARITMPFVHLLLGENTYNQEKRPNKIYDRDKDLQKIIATILNSHRVLIPCFSLQRTQIILYTLFNLWSQNKIPLDTKIILDSPLAEKICNIWPYQSFQNIMNWNNLQIIQSWNESQQIQINSEKLIILSASGFLAGGRVIEWLKNILPNNNNTILFCGYSSENNMASQIRYGDQIININGVYVENNANIIELVSYSSHANFQELFDYYTNQCLYNKLALVHGNNSYKTEFGDLIQNELIIQGKSSRVIITNIDTKIDF